MIACLLSGVGSLLAVYVYFVYFVTGYLIAFDFAGYGLGLLLFELGFGFSLWGWVCYWIVYCCLVIYYTLFYFYYFDFLGWGNFGWVLVGFDFWLGL